MTVMTASPAAPNLSPSCAVCQKTNDVRRCTRCLGIFYCSIEHQREDWSKHQKLCKPVSINSSSSCSQSSDRSLQVCKDTVKVWKRLDQALGLNSSPDVLQWTTDAQWKNGHRLFENWFNSQDKKELQGKEIKLDLSGLELTHLPSCLAKLKISELNLCDNKLEALPDWLSHPFWCGLLRLNCHTFGQNSGEKMVEYYVRCCTNFKHIFRYEDGQNDRFKVITCCDPLWTQIGGYMVLERYVFPIQIVSGEPRILIPDNFDMKLIACGLLEIPCPIKTKHVKVDDDLIKQMKHSHPLAEAFFTGRPSGDQSISFKDAVDKSFPTRSSEGHVYIVTMKVKQLGKLIGHQQIDDLPFGMIEGVKKVFRLNPTL